MTTLLLSVIYLAFISLGLPDAVLGAAWPTMWEGFGVSVSAMGVVTIIIAAGTVVSSLQSHRLIQRWGAHKITTLSVAMTAVALLGFANSGSFAVLCLWAIPYGLGAGSVDAALNNYVAIHFESKHMSWLHCMWGVGATLGPYSMSLALTGGYGYGGGYTVLFAVQAVLVAVIALSAPVWKGGSAQEQGDTVLGLKEIFAIPGVPYIAVAFFCFCALEHVTGLWASSYLVYQRGLSPEVAAGFGALFYLGITVGRFVNGFIAMRYSDTQMIRGGCAIMAVGLVVLLLPLGGTAALVGLSLVGLGSAPVYPCIIHATPTNFGADKAQAIIGVQMACAYTGTLTMPALFGILGKAVGFWTYPLFIAVMLTGVAVMYGKMLKKTKKGC